MEIAGLILFGIFIISLLLFLIRNFSNSDYNIIDNIANICLVVSYFGMVLLGMLYVIVEIYNN